MSDIRDPEYDQDLPVKNNRPFVQNLVIQDIESRKEMGLKKYGTLLQSHNGRNFLLDAYEEALDLVMYLRGALEEQAELEKTNQQKYLDLLRDMEKEYGEANFSNS